MTAKTGEARLSTLEETRRCALGSELPTWRRTSPSGSIMTVFPLAVMGCEEAIVDGKSLVVQRVVQ
jgi:hypothetical protein